MLYIYTHTCGLCKNSLSCACWKCYSCWIPNSTSSAYNTGWSPTVLWVSENRVPAGWWYTYKNMTSSVGMIKIPIDGKNNLYKCSKPPTGDG